MQNTARNKHNRAVRLYRFSSVWALPLAALCGPAAATLSEPLKTPVQSEYVTPGHRPGFPDLIHIAADIRSSDIEKWREFESKDGRFSVQFPGRPRRTEQKTKTDIGYVASVRYTVSHSERVTYDLLFNDFPKAQVASVRAQKLLDAVRDSLLYQTGGRIKTETQGEQNGVRTRHLEIVATNGTQYEVRLLFLGNRLYQLLVASQRGTAPEARRFFDSFSLRKAP